ncbi:MAG: PQQ enzyme repeat protein [Methanoregula sp. PtaU1.Bin051]|nr:MAG: PQQ enzyme repeat protein [Methanoregula sp. PtaU1.Bin051]
MNQMKKIPVIVLILFVVVLPVSGINETTTGSDTISDSRISPTPVWSDLIGTENVLVSCSHDGQYVVAGSNNGFFRMYKRTGEILWTYRNSSTSVTSVSIAGTGEYAAAVFYHPYPDIGETVYFNRNGTAFWKLSQISQLRNNIAMSDDGSIVAVSIDKTLNRLNSSRGIISSTAMPEDICRIAISDDGTASAVASHSCCPWRGASGTISVVDSNGKVSFIYPIDLSFIDIGMSGNGETIAGIDENKLYVFDKNGTLLWNYSSSPWFRSVAISSDGEYISAGSQYYVRFFNRTGALLWDYYDDKGWVNAISISGDGNFVLAGSSNKLLLFKKTGELLWQYPTPSDVMSVISSRDGNYFAAGTKDHVYFFNRWGNTTIIEEPKNADAEVSRTEPTRNQRDTTPATQLASLPAVIPILTIGCLCIFRQVRQWKK